jgi:hypothetical protein
MVGAGDENTCLLVLDAFALKPVFQFIANPPIHYSKMKIHFLLAPAAALFYAAPIVAASEVRDFVSCTMSKTSPFISIIDICII